MSETEIKPPGPGEPVEPNLMPPAVRRAAAEAERLAAEATKAAQEAAQEAQEAHEPLADPSPGATPFLPEGRFAPAEPQVPGGGPPPEPARREPDQREAGRETNWEQRYRSLQGKYDAEVPSLQAQLRQTHGRITSLEGELAELHTRLRVQSPTAAPGAAAGVAPEDVEAYGQEFIDKVRAWTNGGAADPGELARLKAELNGLKTQLNTTATRSVQQQVETALDNAVPNWRAQDKDPAFLAWLQQPDPFSGLVRYNLVNEAYANGDAARTIRIFQAFNAEQTATQVPGYPPAHTPAYNGNGAGSVSLEDLAAPGRGRPASPGAAADRRTWTPDQVRAFYRDAAQGRYSNNEALRQRLEADIHAAPAEGRYLNRP